MVLLILGGSDPARANLRPGELLIYYSWPSVINGSNGNVELAAAEFARYDVLVLGDLLEKTSHPDHANTVAILAHPALAETQVYGYIDLGVSPGQALPIEEIELRLDEWQATGADGVLFDEFGYDYGVTRGRQNAAVDAAHARGVSVIANAWIPGDAFDPAVHPTMNPDGAPPHLGTGDTFLFESFQIQEGTYVPESAWIDKATSLEGFRSILGFSILGVTTSLPADTYDSAKFEYVWYSALLYGYRGVGWGEYLFASDDALAPYHDPPSDDPGAAWMGDVYHRAPEHRRWSDAGEVWVNAGSHAGGFLPGTVDVSETSSKLGLIVRPQPAIGDLQAVWSVSSQAHAPSGAALKIVDPSGRLIDRFVLSATDRAGSIRWTPPATGVYHVILESANTTVTRRVIAFRR